MIYECALVLRPELGEETLKAIKNLVPEVIAEAKGEILISEDWGTRTFAQPFENRMKRGHYIYFMYQANPQVNAELERRYRINENIIRFLTVKLGGIAEKNSLVKNHQTPRFGESQGPDLSEDRDRRSFSKRRSCWFSAKKTKPDWKDTTTYDWLVNEFGKISPQRMTGIQPRFHRQAMAAIKRGRVMGLISNVSAQTAR